MINRQFKYSELTSRIIGCAMKVHTSLGNGFQEVIYQRALAIELEGSKIGFLREVEMPVFYNEQHIGTRRVDFLIEDVVMVELKAVTKLEGVHIAQSINYLEAFKLNVCLLINFGSTRLEFKRLMKNEVQLKYQ